MEFIKMLDVLAFAKHLVDAAIRKTRRTARSLSL